MDHEWFNELMEGGEGKRFENFYLPDMHLKSALDYEPVRNLTLDRQRMSKHQLRSEELLNSNCGLKPKHYRTDIHRLIPIIWSLALKFPVSSEVEITKSFEHAKILLSGSITKKLLEDVSPSYYPHTYTARSFSEWIQSCTVEFTKVIVSSRSGDYYVSKKETKGMKIWFTSEYVVIYMKKEHYVCDHTSWLMLCDVVHQRSASLIISDTYRLLGDNSIVSSSRLLEYYYWGDNLIKDKGVLAYSGLKMWEPIIMGKMMSLASDDISTPTEFYLEMLKDAREEMGKEHCEKLVDLLNAESVPDHLGELFGIYRHWGHPFTYVELAIVKNRSKSMPYHSIDPSFVKQVEREMKQMICEGYFLKNGHWPTLNLRFLREDSELKRAFDTGTPISKRSKNYRKEDWDKVYGAKVFDNGENLNILNVLQDKAAAATLSTLKKLVSKQGTNDWRARRVLSSWLNSSYTCPKTILEKFEREGLDQENLLIGLAKKERELNITPRLFSLMPLELKLYFGLTENLIARDFLPLIEEITMTDSLQELQDKIIDGVMFADKDQSQTPVFISLDFEKWNLQFRHENTHGCFSFLDQMYGNSNLISKTHRIFESIRFYYFGGDKNLTLSEMEQEDGFYSWKGQRGGCEGLRQKGWTIITVALLRVALEPFHVKFRILGQGDNQMIVLSIPCPPGVPRKELSEEQKRILREKILQIKTAIVQASKKMGLPLKAQETWVSNSVFSYGKAIYYKGRPIRSTIKRLCRAFPYANEDYPSIETALTSVVASSQAATAYGPNALGPFIISIIEGRRVIRWHLKYSLLVEGGYTAAFEREIQDHFSTLSPSQIGYYKAEIEKVYFPLLLGANNLGGAPFANFWDYLVRGFPDPLSAQVSYLKDLRDTGNLNEFQKSIVNNLLHPILSKKVDYCLLLQDPLALNVQNPIAIGNILKRSAQTILRGPEVKNPLMKEVVKISTSDQEKIVQYLAGSVPFAPAVCASILSASIPGMVSSLVAKFDKTRTLVKMARESGIPLEARIRNAEEKTVINWLNQASNKESNEEILCPTVYSQHLRDKSWGKKVSGVTVPHPLHLFIREELPGKCSLHHISPEYISLRYSNVTIGKPLLLTHSVGACNPYRGSETMEKINLAKEWEVVQVPSATKGSSELLKMVGWFVRPGTRMEKFLEEVFSCYTDADPNYFKTMEQSVSGNWIHRFKDLFRKHGGYLSCLPTPATHCKPNTNTMGKYSKGKGNYALHFQALIVASMHLDFIFRYRKRAVFSKVHFHLSCEDCLVELEANEFDSKLPVPSLSKLKKESGLWSDKDAVLRGLKPKFSMERQRSSVYDKNEAKYAAVAREVCQVVSFGKQRKIPPNWLFGIEIEKLLSYISIEGPVSLIEYSLAHKYPWNIISNKLVNPTREWKVRIQSLSTSSFKCLEGLFIDPANYSQLCHSSLLREVIPSNHPPSPKDLLGTIKDLLMITVKRDETQNVFPLKEYGPVRIFLRSCSETILRHRSSYNKKFYKWIGVTAKRISDSFFNCAIFEDSMMEYCLNSTIGLPEYQQILFFTSECRDRLLNEYILLPIIKDVMIKDVDASSFQDNIPITRQMTRWFTCEKLYVTRGEENPIQPDMWKKGYEAHYLNYLSTSHGPLLYSLIRSEDREKNYIIFCDGSGGTSLAMSLGFPESRLYIIPYFSENDTVPDLIESLPPDLTKYNPGANALVVDHLTVDLRESFPKQKLSDSTVIIDLDALGREAYNMLMNVIEYTNKSKLMIFISNPNQTMISDIISVCYSSSEKVEVRRSLIHGSNSFLIICFPDKAITSGKSFKRLFTVASDQIYTYGEVEDRLTESTKQITEYYNSRLEWLPIEKGEDDVLCFLCLNSGQFISSSHNEGVKIVDSSGKMTLNKDLAHYYGSLILLFASCGNMNDRMSMANGETSLVTFSDKGVECLAVVEISHEKLVNIRKERSVYYYYLGSEMWKHPLSKRVLRSFRTLMISGKLDHEDCAGKCDKGNNYYVWLKALRMI